MMASLTGPGTSESRAKESMPASSKASGLIA